MLSRHHEICHVAMTMEAWILFQINQDLQYEGVIRDGKIRVGYAYTKIRKPASESPPFKKLHACNLLVLWSWKVAFEMLGSEDFLSLKHEPTICLAVASVRLFLASAACGKQSLCTTACQIKYCCQSENLFSCNERHKQPNFAGLYEDRRRWL